MICDAYCEGCYYFGVNHRTCDYWEKADQLRGCPPGKGCTKKITKKEYMKMAAPKKWDKAAGYEMWKAGKADKEISLALGVSAQAVAMYRKKYWEHGKGVGTQPVPAEPETEEATQDEPVGMETNTPEISEPDEAVQETAEAADDTAQEVPERSDPAQKGIETVTGAQALIAALELIVEDRMGMDAVLTAQVVLTMANWKSVEDLKEARMVLDHMIERCQR